jgi:hypothetical protein
MNVFEEPLSEETFYNLLFFLGCEQFLLLKEGLNLAYEWIYFAGTKWLPIIQLNNKIPSCFVKNLTKLVISNQRLPTKKVYI